MRTTCPVTLADLNRVEVRQLAVIGQSRPSGESLVSPLPVEMSTQQYEQRSRRSRPPAPPDDRGAQEFVGEGGTSSIGESVANVS
jgi:hypothetical protein